MPVGIKTYSSAIVLGLGNSGMSAAQLLLAEGSKVVVVDSGFSSVLEDRKKELTEAGAKIYLDRDTVPNGDYDICVVSPGISKDSSLLGSLEGTCPVISELEYGASRCFAPLIAITGTNGKSTMTKFCYDALSASGERVDIGGNYGVPVSLVAANKAELDWLVLEVSSFQLENVIEFSPRIGVLLNIQPDHLDRHGNMGEYRRCKAELFSRMTSGSQGIVPSDEKEAIVKQSCGSNDWISFGLADADDYRYEKGRVVWSEDGEICEIDIRGSYFDNSILGLSAAASVAVLISAGLKKDQITDAFSEFEPLSHRMELVRSIEGVDYINDSKATNLTSMAAGIEIAGRKTRLIAGGLLKEKISENFKEVLVKSEASVYLIGNAAQEFEEAWGDAVECIQCGDMASAVRRAGDDAREGEVVLLSPGCASFDQFKNYEDRGNKFKEIVNKEM